MTPWPVTELVCPACETVVLTDVVMLSDWNVGFTWSGRRARWTTPLGVVHVCGPAAARDVTARTGRRYANPPWLRFLWRHRRLHPLARRLPEMPKHARLVFRPAPT